MLQQSLPFGFFPPPPPPHSFPSSSSMSPPAILLPSQVEIENFNEIFFSFDHQELNNNKNQFTEEFLVDDLLDLREMPEPEKKAEENEEITKESSFITFEKTEPLLLSDITLPEETEAAHLEWLSRFVHDCHSPEPPASTASPALIPLISKRSRCRRRRRAAELWSLTAPPPLGVTSPVSSYQQNSHASHNCRSNYLKHMPKKRGRKPKNFFGGDVTGGERRCAHCGVQKTPQWRAGPGGPKTLCNACGVRFKSGRLLPEYRPACSPNFISKIHSNSHRKVLEMRRKKDEQIFLTSASVVHSF